MITDNESLNPISLIFGEVLFDCFPDGREVLGGAPFNVAWNLQAFGMHPMLNSRVGDDTHGQRILAKMKSWGMNTSSIQIDPTYPTGKVYIELENGEPLFSILPDQAYDHIAPHAERVQPEPSFLYHGSLAIRNNNSYSALADMKEEYRCPIFVDVNLREPWWNIRNVHFLAEDATWLKLNENELDALFPGRENMEQRCRQILERFDLDALFVTLGKNGAVAVNREKCFSRIAPQDKVSIIDTVGAGDAFSSVLLLGLMNSWPLDTAMRRAQEFASAIVGLRGAITDDRNFYRRFSDRWGIQ